MHDANPWVAPCSLPIIPDRSWLARLMIEGGVKHSSLEAVASGVCTVTAEEKMNLAELLQKIFGIKTSGKQATFKHHAFVAELNLPPLP